MHDYQEKPSAETLLENTQWERRLATQLLYDESLADDVVQEVWITALERPPTKPQAMQAWLGKVVRRLAFRANRSSTRRSRRERQARTVEPVPTPDEMLGHLEMQRELAEAVMELDEAYRSVIYLHYYEEMKLVEIARRLAIPDSTVRTRLARGLEQLRQRLDKEHGGRGQWTVLLAPLALAAGTSHAAAAVNTGRGDLRLARPRASIRPLLIGTVLSLCVVASIVGWVVVVATSSPHPRLAERKKPALERPRETRTAASVAGESSNDPVRVARRPEDVPVVAREEPAADVYPVLLVDSDTGDPVDGAMIHIARVTESTTSPVGKSGADGIAQVPVDILRRDALWVFAEGYVEYREPTRLRDLAGEPYVLELEPVFEARVVVSFPDGSPALGAVVSIQLLSRFPPGDTEQSDPLEYATDADGAVAYAYRHYETMIAVDLYGYPTAAVPASTPTTRVKLVPGRRVVGVVVDSAGAPVEGCRVMIAGIAGPAFRRSPTTVVSDASGRFPMGSLASDAEVSVSLYHPELPGYRQRGSAPATGEWVFRLPDGAYLSGFLEAPDGSPLTEAVVFIVVPRETDETPPEGVIAHVVTSKLPERGRAKRRLVPFLRTVPDEDGWFQVGPTAETIGAGYLFVYHPHYVNYLERVGDVAATPPMTIRLEEGEKIAGRVVSPAGEPMSGVLIHVGELWSNDAGGVVGRVRSGGDGRFEFRGLPTRLEESLSGHQDGAGGPVRRQALFLAVFPPDVFLSMDGLAIGESEIWNGFTNEPGETEIELVAASAAHGVRLDVQLRDPDGLPVRTWTPALVIDTEGGLHTGSLGANAHGQDFFTDHTLLLEDRNAAHVNLTPSGYRVCRTFSAPSFVVVTSIVAMSCDDAAAPRHEQPA